MVECERCLAVDPPEKGGRTKGPVLDFANAVIEESTTKPEVNRSLDLSEFLPLPEMHHAQ